MAKHDLPAITQWITAAAREHGERLPEHVMEQLGLSRRSALALLNKLVGAPAMLDGKDGEALRARIAVADVAGDDAMLQAALAYLPDDVQDAYERQTKSIVSMFNASAPRQE